MSLNTGDRIWNRIEPLLPWSLAPEFSPLEALHGILSGRLPRAGKLTARISLLAGALLITGVIEPSIASWYEKANDWIVNSTLVLTRLLFCLSIAICEWYTQWTALSVLAKLGFTPDTLKVKPSHRQIEFTAFIVGSFVVFALMMSDLHVHVKTGQSPGNLTDPSPARMGLIGVALDAIVWIGFVLPTGARWLGTVWAISLNAAAVTSNYWSTSIDYVLEKFRHTSLLRRWFHRQIGLLTLFLLCASPKVFVERVIYPSEGVLWLLAIILLMLLSSPPLAVYYLVERYRSNAVEALGVRLRMPTGTENDRLDYFALRTIKEPFSEWFLIGSIVTAGGAVWKAYAGTIKILPAVPEVSEYLGGLLSDISQNRIGTACVLAFGAGMILLYLRQFGIDVKTHKQ